LAQVSSGLHQLVSPADLGTAEPVGCINVLYHLWISVVQCTQELRKLHQLTVHRHRIFSNKFDEMLWILGPIQVFPVVLELMLVLAMFPLLLNSMCITFGYQWFYQWHSTQENLASCANLTGSPIQVFICPQQFDETLSSLGRTSGISCCHRVYGRRAHLPASTCWSCQCFTVARSSVSITFGYHWKSTQENQLNRFTDTGTFPQKFGWWN